MFVQDEHFYGKTKDNQNKNKQYSSKQIILSILLEERDVQNTFVDNFIGLQKLQYSEAG